MNKYSHLFNEKMSSDEARYVFYAEAEKIPKENKAGYEELKRAYYPVMKEIIDNELLQANEKYHIW